MKLTVRKNNDRGHADHGWLNSHFTFSFANYYDPNFMGFRSLRVINEDHVAPNKGFPTHGHDNMEILTIILDGSLAHKDSMGNGSTIKAGDIQLMSAGTGVKHSEYNPSDSKNVHLLQIWIQPDTKGLNPGYQQMTLPDSKNRQGLYLIAAKNPTGGALQIHQDVNIYLAQLAAGQMITQPFNIKRYGWIQVAKGKVNVNGQDLDQGDGVSIQDADKLEIKASEPADIILFDLS